MSNLLSTDCLEIILALLFISAYLFLSAKKAFCSSCCFLKLLLTDYVKTDFVEILFDIDFFASAELKFSPVRPVFLIC